MFWAVPIGVPAQEQTATGNKAEMVLVESGRSLASIILPKDPTMFTKIAAADLADCIGKVGGVKPEILEGLPNPVPQHAIWVGFQPKLNEIFPGTNFDFKHPEEILIKCDGKNLIIAGRDVWDPITNRMKIVAGTSVKERQSYLAAFLFSNRDVEGFQSEYGTVNAVYSFLQDKLGVRWLWPGKNGEVVPKQARIAFRSFEFRYHPKIRIRQGVFAPLAIYRQGGQPGKSGGDWVRRQRVQLDSLYAPAGGHGFADWHERFHVKYPEYFALQPDGTRKWKGKPEAAKICVSNPAVSEQWLKDVEKCIEKNPHRLVFNAAANDGYSMGICLCDKCKAWDSPEAEARPWLYPGDPVQSKVDGVALADREITFANVLARKLKGRYPDKDYKVLIHAYGYMRPAPKKATPDANVIISNVANCFSDPDGVDVNSPRREKSIDQFNHWARIAKSQIWRPNADDVANWKTGGPPDITGAGEIFKRIAAKNVLGIWIDTVWFWWGTQGPQYYLMAQLAWNPDRGIEEIMDDYYRSGFGPAAEDIKAYWKMLETNRRDIQQSKGGKSWVEAFNPAFFKAAYAILANAAGKASMAGKEYSDRVAFVGAGLDYLRLNTGNQVLVRQILDSKGERTELEEKMRVNWKQLEGIVREHPEALDSLAKLGHINPDANYRALNDAIVSKQKYQERRKARFSAGDLE